MSAQRLLEHFDRLAEAPDAVPRLRRFILDLAVRGKLVEQDPSDEPATELLGRIQAEKTRLIEDGRERTAKPVLGYRGDAIPFSLPASWQWSQLATVGFISPRNDAADDLMASFVPMPMISAQYGVANQHEIRLWGEIKTGYTHFAEGDVGLAKITPCFENGKSTVFRRLTGGIGAGTTELHIVRPVIVSADYLLIFLKCPHFVNSGIPVMTGTAGQKRVPVDYFSRTPLPIPPLAEQHRIVAKVDELMALCDRLEAAQNQREQRRDQLVVASLRQSQDEEGPTPRCQDAEQEKEPDEKDPGALAPWRGPVFLQHIPRLTTRPEHIKALRQAILNLAVRGRLATQDPSDGSAQDFGIDTELDQNDRLALTLPENWSWAKVEHVAEARLGKMLDKAKNSGLYYRYLRNTNVHWFDIRTDDLKELRVEEADIQRYLLSDGDVIICEGGHGIGRTAVWRGKEVDIIFQKALHRVRPGTALDSDFLAYCLCAYFDAGVLQRYFTGVGIPHFTGKALSSLVFPLPPISEQHRIVAKVDELMAVCDQLEANLTATQTDSRRLLEAVLHEALAPARREAA